MFDYFTRGGGNAMQFIAKDVKVSEFDATTATTCWKTKEIGKGCGV